MKRVILTGTPGCGKTALLRLLEINGHAVVEEAATDIIALEHARGRAEPWTEAGFVDAIVDLQRRRQASAERTDADIVFFDRSPICTYALAKFLRRDPAPALEAELVRIEREKIYDRRVLFLESLGFVTPTAARRISLEDAARFEAVHIETYDQIGYERVMIARATIEERYRQVVETLALH